MSDICICFGHLCKDGLRRLWATTDLCKCEQLVRYEAENSLVDCSRPCRILSAKLLPESVIHPDVDVPLPETLLQGWRDIGNSSLIYLQLPEFCQDLAPDNVGNSFATKIMLGTRLKVYAVGIRLSCCRCCLVHWHISDTVCSLAGPGQHIPDRFRQAFQKQNSLVQGEGGLMHLQWLQPSMLLLAAAASPYMQ